MGTEIRDYSCASGALISGCFGTRDLARHIWIQATASLNHQRTVEPPSHLIGSGTCFLNILTPLVKVRFVNSDQRRELIVIDEPILLVLHNGTVHCRIMSHLIVGPQIVPRGPFAFSLSLFLVGIFTHGNRPNPVSATGRNGFGSAESYDAGGQCPFRYRSPSLLDVTQLSQTVAKSVNGDQKIYFRRVG